MDPLSLAIAAALFLLAAALWRALPLDRSRVRTAIGLLFLWAGCEISSTLVSHWNSEAHVLDEVARTFLVLSAVQLGFLLIFELALSKVNLPKFAGEIALVAGWIITLFQLFSRLGVNATGIFATSAVATAVLGLALQDMLSNIAGGIALELEGGMEIGDFIRCGDHSGWVKHVRLRYTAIATADGDTVILPNSLLTRSPVVILSRAHRHFVHFVMPYAYNPQVTIETIEDALRASPLPGVVKEPKPRCFIQQLEPGHIRYSAAVWLSNPGGNTETDSAVLNRIYYALDRAGIPASEISYLIERKAFTPPTEEVRPAEALRGTPIFRLLSDEQLVKLSPKLRRLSFAPGEHILRQGEPGDSMYFVVAGHVSISVHATDGGEKQLAVCEAGDFFGEASLLTGEVRNATATATSRVVCYRLDKAGVQNTMEAHPELAEDMSAVMAHRQIGLATAREMLDRETALRREAESQMQLLARIRRFFDTENSTATTAD